MCGCGGIGRRTWFRSRRREAWGFESLHPHQNLVIFSDIVNARAIFVPAVGCQQDAMTGILERSAEDGRSLKGLIEDRTTSSRLRQCQVRGGISRPCYFMNHFRWDGLRVILSAFAVNENFSRSFIARFEGKTTQRPCRISIDWYEKSNDLKSLGISVLNLPYCH